MDQKMYFKSYLCNRSECRLFLLCEDGRLVGVGCPPYMAVSVSKFSVSTRNWFFFAIYVGLVPNWYLEFVIFKYWYWIGIWNLGFLSIGTELVFGIWDFVEYWSWLVLASVPVSAVIVLVFSSKSYHQSEAVNCSMFLMWLDHSPDKPLVSLVSPDFDSSW